jgi:N-ethylmaleimide reductase
MNALSQLFSNYQLGAFTLPNRLIMAPLTRGRAGQDRIPNELMVEYYAQRASAGLIITEATNISETAAGWLNSPGIHNDAQVKGWQKVTEAVHNQGGRIYLQLWHCGRASHQDFQPHGETPVSSSAIAAVGDVIVAVGEAHTANGKKPYPVPRALEISEIPGLVQDYVAATRRAQEAGFDGVEIHSANGYLLDQFLRDGVNQRTDAYGGSVANRSRLLLEVTEAVIKAWSADQVGVRLSPTNGFNDMRDSDPIATFTAVARSLNDFNLAYLHVMEALPGHPFAGPGERVTPHIRQAYQGTLMINGGYDGVTGEAAIANQEADLIAYGVPFLTNPDLTERIKHNAPLNPPDFDTFYTPGAKGYTDYPLLAAS